MLCAVGCLTIGFYGETMSTFTKFSTDFYIVFLLLSPTGEFIFKHLSLSSALWFLFWLL
jgi:hypothetical protein